MGQSLQHRGPDSRALIRNPRAGIGCERLRVVDIHERADQPFCDPKERFWLACNGEIYNAPELRRRYHDYPYRSQSDVETILPLFLDRGLEGLAELDGMFAVAIWDTVSETLTLARDRAGEKPLFYSQAGGEIWFASELQALLLDPAISRELDETAIHQFLALGYVPEPRTTFNAIRKLAPGTLVQITASSEDVHRYWNPVAFETVEEPLASSLPRLRALLRSAVRKQLQADVPVGIFLSGGMDSALLAAIAAEVAPDRKLDTFTARFADPSYDESAPAGLRARRHGARHHEVMIDERSLGEALGAVTSQLAEPLADPAVLPTYLLAREARQHVTVILSGEGADELFGGYPTYLGHKLVPYVKALPAFLRRGLRSTASLLPASRGKVTVEFLLKRFLADAEKPWLERHLAWFGSGAQHLLAESRRTSGSILDPLPPDFTATGLRGALLLDYRTYLPDDLLVKNDRATMLESLEARAPFLDKDLSSFALGLPERWKVRGLTTKWLLKRAAQEWLPRSVIYRRKRGLSVPVASWLDTGLRSEVDRLLAPERLARQGWLDPRGVERLLTEHRARHANHARPLWTLVVFQSWLERWAPEEVH